MLNRDDFRKTKNMSKDEMDKWLRNRDLITHSSLKKQFEKMYNEDLLLAIDIFIVAIAYTLHFSEDTHFEQNELTSFLDDLFVTIDMFKTGEYKAEDYREELEKCGVKIKTYDYSKRYRDNELKYKNRNEEALKWLNRYMSEGNCTCNLEDLQLLENILNGEYGD